MTTSRARRHRGEGAVWQRQSDGLWVGSAEVGYKNGKRQRKRVYATTQRECIRKLAAAKKAIADGDLTTSSMRLEAWLRYWLDDVAAVEVKPRTLSDYRSKAEQYVIPTLGRHRLDRLTAVHIRDLHRSMRDKGVSERTIRHTHYLLSGALDDAMTHVGLSRNVAKLVRPPMAVTVEERALTPAECRRILDAADTDRARWLFALYTGTRQGEALGLRWGHVNLDNGTAEIEWALQRVPYIHGCQGADRKPTCGKRANGCPSKSLGVQPGMDCRQLDGNLCLVRPKTKRSRRELFLVPGLVHALRALQASDGPNPHGLVFHRDDGRPVDGRQDYRAWCDLLVKAKVDHLPLHSTRHTAATLMEAAGVPEPIRMQVLGHTLAETTRGYTHTGRELTRGAMEALAAEIEN